MKKSKIPKLCQNIGLDELFLEKNTSSSIRFLFYANGDKIGLAALTSVHGQSGKFALLSRAIKHSDIHLEVLSLQNRKSFEYFFCFHRTLGISPKDLEGYNVDIPFTYTALACSLAISTNVEL